MVLLTLLCYCVLMPLLTLLLGVLMLLLGVCW